MTTATLPWEHTADYPVKIRFDAAPLVHNRLTTAFRWILAIPHVLLVGGPVALMTGWAWTWDNGNNWNWGTAGGVLGAVAGVIAVIAWFAILFTGRYPTGLYNLAAFYLRWRVRAVSYIALLRDEYPPFGDGPYPVQLELRAPAEPRDKLSVAFRILLAIPQIIAVWALTIAWAVTTFIAWLAILFTGRYPEGLYHFSQGVLRWTIRVEAYLLLLQDEYPPFALE
jgi:Domain of unknown function (DUF4389)